MENILEKGLKGKLQEAENLDNLLESLGLIPSKDTTGPRPVGTKVYRIQDHGFTYLIRIWLDARIGEGTVKVRKYRGNGQKAHQTSKEI